MTEPAVWLLKAGSQNAFTLCCFWRIWVCLSCQHFGCFWAWGRLGATQSKNNCIAMQSPDTARCIISLSMSPPTAEKNPPAKEGASSEPRSFVCERLAEKLDCISDPECNYMHEFVRLGQSSVRCGSRYNLKTPVPPVISVLRVHLFIQTSVKQVHLEKKTPCQQLLNWWIIIYYSKQENHRS